MTNKDIIKRTDEMIENLFKDWKNGVINNE